MSDFAPADAYGSPLDGFFPPEKERVDAPTASPKHEFELEDRRRFDNRRAVAFFIDLVVVVGAAVALIFAVGFGDWFYILYPALYLSYFYVCEALTGQTVGKRAMKLRVMHIRGKPVGPLAVNGRTVLRLIDSQFFFLFGLCTMILTRKRRQRLGDLVTGTIVRPADRPHVPGPRPALLPVYPVLWIGAAVLICLQLGLFGFQDPPMHSKLSADTYMRDVNQICKRSLIAERKMGADPTGAAMIRTLELEFGAIASLPSPPPESRADYRAVMRIERATVQRVHRLDASLVSGDAHRIRAAARSVERFAKQRSKRFRKLGLPYCAQV